MAGKMDARINLKQMVQMAESISRRGVNLSIRFENMLQDVADMQAYWQGESYVKFVKVVNDAVPTLNEMQQYFTVKLPREIAEKRNQYAKSDQRALINVNDVTYTKYDPQVAITVREQGDELIFKSTAMLSQADKLDQRFDNILKINLPNIEDDFNSISWKGDTGDNVKRIFKENMESTKEAVRRIRKAFRDCLVNQANAMDAAEEANKASSSTSDIVNRMHDVAEKAGSYSSVVGTILAGFGKD